MPKAYYIYILGLAILLLTGAIYSNHKPKSKPINVILIITDDQSAMHMGYAGDKVVKTPNIDALARQGVVFSNAFNNAPACAPSRASMLTGRNFWELEEAAIHFSFFPGKFETFTDLLASNGYEVGYTGKGWGPGLWQGFRRTDPTGKSFQVVFYDSVPTGINKNHYAANFRVFHKQAQKRPYFFLMGTTEHHRDMAYGMGEASGLIVADVEVPDFLPDNEVVRQDLLDYYYEISWVDKQVGEVVDYLKEKGEFENTVIIITSDNGMAFPRAKSNLYDHGSHLPLLICGTDIARGVHRTDFVTLKDLAPTILELTGLTIPQTMTGKSLLPQLTDRNDGRTDHQRNHVVMGKELHAWCHPNGEINPVRAIRTDEYLYIQNMKPDLWPAGDPDPRYSWDLNPFGDVDDSPTKEYILKNRSSDEGAYFFELAFGKRPSEELYQVVNDPFQLQNLAFKPGYQEIKKDLSMRMREYLIATGDPRTLGNAEVFDKAPYFWSHGLETAGLPLSVWEQLTVPQQEFKVDSVAKHLYSQSEKYSK